MRNTDIHDLYNTYLRISRKKQNKPYKLRVDWNGFEQSEHYIQVLRLKNFFDRNYIVNIEDFFTAPYEVYEENTYYGLDFYNTLAAVKVYNIYCNYRRDMDPDSEVQKNFALKGLKFITKFCIDNRITLSEYIRYTEPEAKVNAFVQHLKEKNISIYNLFAFKDFDKIFSSLDYALVKFILDDIASKISIYRSKFYGSKNLKKISTIGLKAIEKTINQKLA